MGMMKYPLPVASHKAVKPQTQRAEAVSGVAIRTHLLGLNDPPDAWTRIRHYILGRPMACWPSKQWR